MRQVTFCIALSPAAAFELGRRSFVDKTRKLIHWLFSGMGDAFSRSTKCLRLLLGIGWLAACNLSTPAPPTPLPSATPAIPQVRILYPPHNQRVIEGVIFDIDILASDPEAEIQRVELWVDEELLQSSETETGLQQSYRVTTNWFAKGIGWHKFSALAYRADGSASHPHVIALEVIPQS